MIEVENIQVQEMAIEQTNVTEAIAQALAEAARVTMQAMAVARAETVQDMKKHKMKDPNSVNL